MGLTGPPRVLEAASLRLLPVAAGLWLGYALLFFVIDRLYIPRSIPPVYYLLNSSAGVLVLGLTKWKAARTFLGQAFLPLVIILMTLPPIIGNHVILPQVQTTPVGNLRPGAVGQVLPGPTLSAEGVTLRLLPALLLALVLTAWYYRWAQVVIYCLGTAALTLALHLVGDPDMLGTRRPPPSTLLSPILITLLVIGIQTLCLLIAGYFLTELVQRLRQQQRELAEANTQLRRYAGTLESLTISRERNRVARELHDTLAHTLSGLTVQLETVKALWPVDPVQAQARLDRAEQTARAGLAETRAALTTLRVTPLEDLGLVLALRQLAEAAADRAALHLDLHLAPDLPPLLPDVEQCLYRVAQEAIANVVYHADGTRLTVQLDATASGLRLQVQDDGVGFQPDQAARAGHFGLAGMQERARLIGGQLAITSHAGRGTLIALTIPHGGALQ